MKNQIKTLACVATAGIFFILAIIFDLWYLVLIGAVFDWLPLPTGWMKLEDSAEGNKKAIISHAITTLVAYIFAVVWIISVILLSTFAILFKVLFMEIWWGAVMIGTLITK
ncbi:MAG: hypothetical protein ACTSVY_03430 [Candidatus Helarchaeota archaeon]